ncbi:S8 family serine peptidase [Candidatus Uhrbacteria bacterium]|nr:S8 family serine peptidase [Candidatus Uhrbacteria bacterium]
MKHRSLHSRFTQGVLFCFLLVSALPVQALTPDDEYFNEQWYLQNIEARDAWDTHTGDGSVVVAVLDTGIDLDHPDLQANIWVNAGEVALDGVDNDGNGYVDDLNGYDFIDDDGTPIPNQDGTFDEGAVSHGTVIAGIIGAVGDNDEGIAGIVWDVQLMSVRILDNQGIGDSNLARLGVEYAMRNGADVINLSFTGFDFDEVLRRTIQEAYEAGIVVVAAMGNADDGGVDIDESPIYPACFGERADEDWILGVAATDQNDVKAEFSNYGALCTDISAPGQDILSAVYQDDDWPAVNEGFYQDSWSGTSMASPMVAGAAALLKSAYHSLTPGDIKSILRLSVDPVTATGDAAGKMGAGRLNVATALALAPSFADVGDIGSSVSSSTSSSYRIAVAPESGSPPTVRVFTNSGSEVFASFNAYDASYTGGVRLTMGDVDGDGAEEIVTVPGPGGGPQVRVFDLEGNLEGQFYAFEVTLRSGLYVATGDIDGDGIEEIAVSTDAGGGGRVQVFDKGGVPLYDAFRPYGAVASMSNVSVRVALGDVDGDGSDEVTVGPGEGHEPRIRIHTADGTLVSEFLAYADTYDKGVFVASGDLDGDGDDEVVTGTDNGGGPQVQIFDGQGTWLGTFFAYDAAFRGGVRLSVGNLSEWPGASIITAAGPGGGPHIRVYNGYAKLIGTFFSDDQGDRAGINSAAWGL